MVNNSVITSDGPAFSTSFPEPSSECSEDLSGPFFSSSVSIDGDVGAGCADEFGLGVVVTGAALSPPGPVAGWFWVAATESPWSSSGSTEGVVASAVSSGWVGGSAGAVGWDSGDWAGWSGLAVPASGWLDMAVIWMPRCFKDWLSLSPVVQRQGLVQLGGKEDLGMGGGAVG